MIRKFLNIFIWLSICAFSLYLIQGACYRLVEPYAKLRLSLSWGEPESLKIRSIINKLPMDHFVEPLSSSSPISSEAETLEEEFTYARRIMSFSRPARDRYYNFIREEEDPLRNFEIAPLGMVEEVVQPGLRRPATPMDVSLGFERREGLPVDFSKALFVRVIPKMSRTSYEIEFGKWEKVFAFLLNQGIACVLLESEDSDELAEQLSYLQSQYPNFAKNMFCLAEGNTVGTLLNAVTDNQYIAVRCLVVINPTDEITQPEASTDTWFLGILPNRGVNPSILSSLINRVRLNRGSNFVYHSRLSGLIHQDSSTENIALSSFPIAYIVSCLEFYRDTKSLESLIPMLEESNASSFLAESNMTNPKLVDFSPVKLDDLNYTSLEPNFDCEVVREYRQLNNGDPSIADLSNRDLVLQLGASFEDIGIEVLEQIADRDPLFYRFYLSLKELETSPN